MSEPARLLPGLVWPLDAAAEELCRRWYDPLRSALGHGLRMVHSGGEAREAIVKFAALDSTQPREGALFSAAGPDGYAHVAAVASSAVDWKSVEPALDQCRAPVRGLRRHRILLDGSGIPPRAGDLTGSRAAPWYIAARSGEGVAGCGAELQLLLNALFLSEWPADIGRSSAICAFVDAPEHASEYRLRLLGSLPVNAGALTDQLTNVALAAAFAGEPGVAVAGPLADPEPFARDVRAGRVSQHEALRRVIDDELCRVRLTLLLDEATVSAVGELVRALYRAEPAPPASAPADSPRPSALQGLAISLGRIAGLELSPPRAAQDAEREPSRVDVEPLLEKLRDAADLLAECRSGTARASANITGIPEEHLDLLRGDLVTPLRDALRAIVNPAKYRRVQGASLVQQWQGLARYRIGAHVLAALYDWNWTGTIADSARSRLQGVSPVVYSGRLADAAAPRPEAALTSLFKPQELDAALGDCPVRRVTTWSGAAAVFAVASKPIQPERLARTAAPGGAQQ